MRTTLILVQMGFSGFSVLKGAGGSAQKDQAQSSGHFIALL